MSLQRRTGTDLNAKSCGFRATALAGFLALAFVLAPALAAAEDAPAAVLTAASGEVRIERAGETLDGSFGAPLLAGDGVSTGPQGKASILFASGQLIQLGPGSRVTISEAAEQDTGDLLFEVPDLAEGDAPLFAQAASTDQGLAALSPMRSGEQELDVIAPRNTRIRAGSPTFTWTEVEEALEYTVVLSGPGAAAGKHRATGTTWTPGADATFGAGEQWTWHVEAMTPEGPVASRPVSFDVATDDEVRELARLEERMQPLLTDGDELRSDTASYLLGTWCRSMGFYAEAIDHLETLANRHGDHKELHRQLGSLYQAIGRNDLAAAAFRLALED